MHRLSYGREEFQEGGVNRQFHVLGTEIPSILTELRAKVGT